LRRYWWVNHKQTSKHEIAGGYLWSPKHTKNGASNYFYSTMTQASAGDYVLSFADATISFLGTVTGAAGTSAKPPEFGKAGSSWAEEGWRLPIAWTRLERSVQPKLFMDEIAPLLRSKYAPLKANGGGNEMYLTEIDFALFQMVLSKANVDLDLAFATPELATIFGDLSEQLDEAVARQLEISLALSATEISQVIKARRGQGLFRTNVQKIEQRCRLTAVESPFLLVASHIKPWRSCANSQERLDGNNGLLLTPHVDLLFDRGLISFTDSGDLLVSNAMSASDMQRLGLHISGVAPRSFNRPQCSYLEYHRTSVFISEAKLRRPSARDIFAPQKAE
jgi:putative restriction endonuclease